MASAKTNANGSYSIKFTPHVDGSYQASTGQISKVENATLNPTYGDILSPAATSPVKVKFHGAA